MQSGVPSLPVVCSDKHSCSSSKYSDSINGTPRKSKSPFTNSTQLLKRRPFNEMYTNSPYRSSTQFYSTSQPSRSNKNPVCQRILSAKMLRVKQLQNQLTDAHYHLNELSNENKLLKAIQKKQESALKKYEGANAELPRIINSHHEELRILQIKYKKLKEQHKSTSDTLKEKEKELHSLQVFNKRLLQLSQDRNLLEREKLQFQVSDLNHQIQKQQDTITTLNRKLALETKSLKQQIHAEAMKHKETQKNLHDSLEKLKSLEDLLDNREKRMYYNNQLPGFSKNRSVGNYSFSSLEDSGVSLNCSKSNIKKIDSDINEKLLPTLSDLDMNFDKKINGKNVQDGHFPFASLEKKFRLSKSGNRSISAKSLDRLDKSPNLNTLEMQKEEDFLTLSSQELDKIDVTDKEDEKLSKKNLTDELDFSDVLELNDETDLQHENLFRKSREVCARLMSDHSPAESFRTIVYHHNNDEDIEKSIKSEYKIGHEMAINFLQNGMSKNYGSQNDEDVESDGTNHDVSILNLNERLYGSKVVQKEDEDVENFNEKIEDPLENSNSREENGSRTFRQLSDNDLENCLDKLDLKEVVMNENENIEHNPETEEQKEKLNIYLNGEDKLNNGDNGTENITEVNSEARRNSVEKNGENEKKEGEKLSKKGYDKDKLLAEIKAIDDNDNIEYCDQKLRRHSSNNIRLQITENLYRGIPTQRRGDAITNIFTNTKVEAKTRGNGFTKFH